MDIERFEMALPHGITLACRAAGPRAAPLLVFLHGFPEAAFVWDELLRHFGTRWRCIAPDLRGYGGSSAPVEVEAYRAKHLVGDVAALIGQLGGRAAAVVAHDWGGAVAWGLAAAQPALLERLVIVNSPHPAVFLRELRGSPAQQAASAYMNALCRPDAEARLSAADFAALWELFAGMGALDADRPGGGWLTPAVRAQYREVWRRGLTGGLNYYRASPLRPPESPTDPVMTLELPAALVTVTVPTLVLWGEDDTALPPSLLDGLEAFVPRLRTVRIPRATHWVVHEQPQRLAAEIDTFLRDGR